MRDSLRWLDGELESIGDDAYEHLLDLVIVHGWIHRGRAKKDWNALGPTTYFSEVWEEAMQGAPNWPGFRRTILSVENRAYFERDLARPPDEHF